MLKIAQYVLILQGMSIKPVPVKTGFMILETKNVLHATISAKIVLELKVTAHPVRILIEI